MRVEILKPVNLLGVILRNGTVEAPEKLARHWIATGAARNADPPTPPAPVGASAAKSGESKRS